MIVITAKDKCSHRVSVTTPDGTELNNIFSVELNTMQGYEFAQGVHQPVDLSHCTITIKPIK